ATHPSAVHPWEWVFKYSVMPFWNTPQYFSALNPTLWIMIVPVFVYYFIRTWQSRNDAAVFGLSWYLMTLVVWIIYGFVSNRITYVYYLYPFIGAIALGVGLIMEELVVWGRANGKLKNVYWGIAIFLMAHAVFFLLLSPFTGV